MFSCVFVEKSSIRITVDSNAIPFCFCYATVTLMTLPGGEAGILGRSAGLLLFDLGFPQTEEEFLDAVAPEKAGEGVECLSAVSRNGVPGVVRGVGETFHGGHAGGDEAQDVLHFAGVLGMGAEAGGTVLQGVSDCFGTGDEP